MKFPTAAFAVLLASALAIVPADASFGRDVVRQSHKRAARESQKLNMEDELLAKAVPLAEYKRKLRLRGYSLPETTPAIRELEDGGDGDDDYYMGEGNMYSFNGYSLKFAMCQPVQRFSEDAIAAGERTTMVVDDIVVLRLCPYRFCTSSGTYGCQYNFAEYAIDLGDYVRIMLRYTEDKKEQICNWCADCEGANGNNNGGDRRGLRKLEGDDGDGQQDGNQDQNEGNDNGQDGQQDNDGDDKEDNNDNQDNQSNDNNNDGGDDGDDNGDDGDDGDGGDDDGGNDGGDDDADNECASYNTYCLDDDGNSMCADNEDDDDAYMASEDYLNYLNCVQIEDEDRNPYYVRPRCDGEQGTFEMSVFYDQFCSQYAGDKVDLKTFGLGFQSSLFEPFYESTCINCGETDYPPYFTASSNMCNRIHVSGAKCMQTLQYDLFGGAEDSMTECSFIESLRTGTYDENGELYVGRAVRNANRVVTIDQKIGIVLSGLIVMILALYSCYLHHSITNLLIKSLSHTDLLPPSRHKSPRGPVKGRSSPPRTNSRRGRKKVASGDWDNGGTLA